MPYATNQDTQVHYEVSGEGIPLLCDGSGLELDRTKVQMASVSERFWTDKTRSPVEPFTVNDLAVDALCVMDALGWESCAVKGHSHGGKTALQMALQFPDRISRLVLMGTSAGRTGAAGRAMEKVLYEGDDGGAAYMLVANTDTRWDAQWQSENQERFNGLVQARTATLARVHNDTGFRYLIEAIAGFDVWDRLPELKMPVLLCAGAYDGLEPVSSMQRMHKLIPHSTLHVFEGNHWTIGSDPGLRSLAEEFVCGSPDG